MSGAIDWNEYGLDFEKLKEQVEALRGQQIELQLLMQSDPTDQTARMLHGQAAATTASTEGVVRELERCSDPTFDFDAAARTQKAAAAGGAASAAAAAAVTAPFRGRRRRRRSEEEARQVHAAGWAASAPISTHRLEAIKDGEVVFTLELAKRPFFVLGKQKELVHVQLEHGSISRQHCAIVHGTPPKADGGGDAWLIDLESAHGTYMGASADALRKIKPHVPYPGAPLATVVRVGTTSLARVQGPRRRGRGRGRGRRRCRRPRTAPTDSEPPAKRRRGDDDDPPAEARGSLGLASLSVNWYAAFLMTLLRPSPVGRRSGGGGRVAGDSRIFDRSDLAAIPPEFYVTRGGSPRAGYIRGPGL